jgi:hypothetical protein
MNFTAALANLAWLAASAPAQRRFVTALSDPAAAQRRWLRSHLERNAASGYARAHGLGAIRNYEEFAQRVPIVSYDDLAPWIVRIRRGEDAVLTSEPVRRLVPTSGSSGARKLIPFTATLQAEFNAAIAPWWSDLCRQHRSVPFGRAYWSISPLGGDAPVESSAVPIGFDDDSDYLGGTRARLVNTAMAVPSAVRHLRDHETFRHVVLLSLLRCPDLRFISVWHPSFLTLLLDALPQHWDRLLSDLEHGLCQVDGRFRAAPARARAAHLRAIAPNDVEKIWPDLRVVSCWADANAAGAAAALQQRLPGVSLQAKGLLATEAFVTVPFRGAHPLALTSHFFEFEDDRGRVHLLEDLRAGEYYAVIVTTGGGLWRYRLGDRVEVTGFVERTPSLRFLGRTGGSDRCGEKLSEAFVAQAIAAACRRSAAAPIFALLSPEETPRALWRYVLHVESAPAPELRAHLEDELRRNPHYALCRDLGQLEPLAVRFVARGYETFTRRERERGLRLGDIKPACLSPRTDWAKHFRAATEERADGTDASADLPVPPSGRR